MEHKTVQQATERISYTLDASYEKTYLVERRPLKTLRKSWPRKPVVFIICGHEYDHTI